MKPWKNVFPSAHTHTYIYAGIRFVCTLENLEPFCFQFKWIELFGMESAFPSGNFSFYFISSVLIEFRFHRSCFNTTQARKKNNTLRYGLWIHVQPKNEITLSYHLSIIIFFFHWFSFLLFINFSLYVSFENMAPYSLLYHIHTIITMTR